MRVCTGVQNFRQNKQLQLGLSVQVCAKIDLELEIQKTNIVIRISIVKMPCMPIFRKNEQLWLFRPKFAQNRFWDRNFKILSPHSKPASLRYYVDQFSDKTNNIEFLGPNSLKNGFWGRNFKNQSLDLVGMSASNIPCVPIFSQNG